MSQDVPDPEVPRPPAGRPADPAGLNQPAPKGDRDGGESVADDPGTRAPRRPEEESRFERTLREARRLAERNAVDEERRRG